ncbi:MAG: alpha/beta hydrolase [Simkaniaceae bacterium]|nr:MAG: alpha/beta hydrolase [Simkaniaceae bacterium]
MSRISSGFSFPSSYPNMNLGRGLANKNIKLIAAIAFSVFTLLLPIVCYKMHTSLLGDETKSIQDERHYFQVVYDWNMATFREIQSRAFSFKERGLDRLGFRKDCYLDPTSKEPIQWKENSSCLILFVHGLDGHPSHFAQYKSLLDAENRDIHLLYTLNRGRCSTEDGASPILSIIANYREKHSQNPIVLVGTSRGGPLMAHIELELRKHQKSRVYVGTVSGANNGSYMMTLAKVFKVGFLLFPQELISVLDFNHEVPQSLIQKQKKPLSNQSVRQFDYWATTGDLTVVPCSSGLPDIPDASHFLVHGQGHTSIVDHVVEEVTSRVETFLSESS